MPLQLIANLSGMKVQPARSREYGLATLELNSVKTATSPSLLLKSVKNHSKVWMSHGDKISEYPRDFIVTGRTKNSEVAVIESRKRKIFGVQFHPEVVHTAEGKTILSNFLFGIAGLKADWNMRSGN